LPGLNSDQIINIADWLLAQCHREDGVGRLARRWVDGGDKNQSSDCERWIENLGIRSGWQDAVSTAKTEFEDTLICLGEGRSSITFPKLFASPNFNKITELASEFHSGQPMVSPEAYLRGKHIELQNDLKNLTLIYLDTNHWINLRHVCLGTSQRQSTYSEILDLLERLRDQNKILCPVSFPLFLELMKQSDEKTRLATSRLMERFSGGVCFQHPVEIQRLELKQPMLRTMFGKDAPDLSEWIFTKVGYIAGELLPFNAAYSKEQNNLIQKVCVDLIWMIPVEQLAALDPEDMPPSLELNMAVATNTDADWYRSRELSFEDIFAQEKALLLRSLMNELSQIAKELWDQYPDHRNLIPGVDIANQVPDIRMLPSVQVKAGVNAALFKSKKKFKENDIIDFQHAALATPYCDALLCDSGMAHVLRSKPLEFGKIYETEILNRPNEIVDYLKNLAR
jgi:hypothetical protein